jgi:hypothetical protein
VVRASVQLGIEQRPLADATTGADGTYALDVPALAKASPLEQSLRTVRAYAFAPGHRPSPRKEVEAVAAGGEREADFVLAPGATLVGRVVAADGRPMVWASVVLCHEVSDERSYASTDGGGRYAIPIEAGGRHVLSATRDGGGSASRPLDLDPARDEAATDLVLVGPGAIEGRAVHPDGSAAPSLVVQATAEPWEERRGACEAWGDGLRQTQATTDADGRFRLAGLRPGRYHVFPAAEPGSGAVHETGERDARIACAQHRLVVLVRDGAGVPLRGASYSATGETDDTSFSGAGSVHSLDASVVLPVEPGMRMRVDLTAGDLTGSADLVVPDDGWTHPLTVVVGTPGGTGRVRVTARSLDGGEVPFRAELQSAIGGVPSVQAFSNAEGGLSPAVPAGRYELTAWPGRVEGQEGREPFVPVRSRVEVRGGATVSVPVEARAGGRVRLTLRGDGAAIDAGRLVVELRGGDGDVRPLHSFRAGGGEAQGLVLGRPGTSDEAVPPGRWVLRVSGPGVRTEERVVDVVAGETVSVDVLLQAGT